MLTNPCRIIPAVLSMLLLMTVDATAVTLTVTDGVIGGQGITDFEVQHAVHAPLSGEGFSISSIVGGIGTPAVLTGGFIAAGTSVPLSGQAFIVGATFDLGSVHYPMGNGNLAFTSTASVILPTVVCPCAARPIISVSTPFTMVGELTFFGSALPPVDATFSGTGIATGVFGSTSPSGSSTWELESISYVFASPAAVPEPGSLLLLASGVAALALLKNSRLQK